MDVSRDLQSHFSRLPKYIHENIVFYDKHDYDRYIKHIKLSAEKKLYDRVCDNEHSKK